MDLSPRKRNTCQFAQLGDEPFLEFEVGRLSGRLLRPEVMPVATADQGGGLVAYGQPGLGPLPGVDVHRAPGPPILARAQPDPRSAWSSPGRPATPLRFGAGRCSGTPADRAVQSAPSACRAQGCLPPACPRGLRAPRRGFAPCRRRHCG